MTESKDDVELSVQIERPHVAEHDLCADDTSKHGLRIVDRNDKVSIRGKRISDPPGATAEIENTCTG